MVISTYQVNNVLRVYGEQLRQNRVSSKFRSANTRSPDRIQISAEAKRKAIVEKIASDIVDRITHYGPRENAEKEVSQNLQSEYGVHLDITRKSPTDLVFKVIDEEGESINTLSIEDSGFSKYKLQEVPKNDDKTSLF